MGTEISSLRDEYNFVTILFLKHSRKNVITSIGIITKGLNLKFHSDLQFI